MEIRPFLYVNQIAECGSMTKAAAALFITQPALSNYISKLEEELGVRLFDRSVTPLRLTYAGERYLAYTRRILMQVGDLEREMRDISRNQRGRIRLGFPGERMICMLPVLLPAFQEKYPGIRIETENGSAEQLVRALREGDVDFVFLPMWEKHRGISHQKNRGGGVDPGCAEGLSAGGCANKSGEENLQPGAPGRFPVADAAPGTRAAKPHRSSDEGAWHTAGHFPGEPQQYAVLPSGGAGKRRGACPGDQPADAGGGREDGVV